MRRIISQTKVPSTDA